MHEPTPIRATIHSGGTIHLSTSINVAGQWKKFTMSCTNGQELWTAMQTIHENGTDKLAEVVGHLYQPSTKEILTNTKSLDQYIADFIASGGTITRAGPSTSAKNHLNPTIDCDALIAEINNLQPSPSPPAIFSPTPIPLLEQDALQSALG